MDTILEHTITKRAIIKRSGDTSSVLESCPNRCPQVVLKPKIFDGPISRIISYGPKDMILGPIALGIELLVS
jgi:hypothetical protein